MPDEVAVKNCRKKMSSLVGLDHRPGEKKTVNM